MKLKTPGAATTARPPVNRFLGICLAACLTIYAPSAVAKTGARGLNPAEEWVVAQATAGEKADLSEQFAKDRNLSVHFLEDLLTGTLPGVKLHRHGVQINGAIFDEPIDLANAQIPCEVWLDHCQFNESVTFTHASFAGNVAFENSTFKADAYFSDMKVGGDAFFVKAVFEGPVDFSGADIASNFAAIGAKFQNKEKTATFVAMKVRGAAFFEKAVFEGPVNFVAAEIASSFGANEAQFHNKEKGASFNAMKVQGAAFFVKAVFEGPVDFSYADFTALDLSSPFWPKVAAQFHIQRMSYKYIRAGPGNEPESHTALLKLADQSAYTADVYSNLEEFFLRQGYRGDADRAFIAGKRRERKENLHGLGWFGSCLLDWLVGYGRRPWQAGIPCAALIALGCALFSPKKMEPQKPEDTPRVYSRFWYSLGLFLPFVDLQADKVWKPKADQTFLRNYMRVHVLLGWILVPLVLAALTGLIK
jgi:uncharacterized protein YjbI with pentapeptide repeats